MASRNQPGRISGTFSSSVGPRRILTEVDDRVGGKRLTTEAPYHFSDAESGVRRPAAYRGEHNAEVLAEWLGRSSSETDALAETGVLAKQDPIADRR
jgi:CoA:oxalate CoA-transferase